MSTITVELPLVFPSDPDTITLEPEQTTVLLDREIAIAATVSDEASVPIPAVQVQFGEQFATATVTADVLETDTDGRVSATFSSAEAGEATITATVVTVEGGVVIRRRRAPSTPHRRCATETASGCGCPHPRRGASPRPDSLVAG